MNLKKNKNKVILIENLDYNNKPKVIHHTNELTMGGTEKLIQINMPYYLKDEHFEHYLAYRSNGNNPREIYFKDILDEDHMISYEDESEFVKKVEEIKPFIMHRYSAGIPEFPFVNDIKKNTKYFVSTSTFGNQDDTIDIESVIYVSSHIRNLCKKQNEKNHGIVRIPVCPPCSENDLRDELGIDENTFVFGRIGRDDNNIYDPIAIESYYDIEKENDVCYLAVAPSDLLLKDIERLGVKNFKYIDRTTDEKRLSSFYNTIDVLAHSRKDGECNPLNIWEAFSHGKPVISHYGFPFNGHVESIDNCGFVVLPQDKEGYKRLMLSFVNGDIDYNKISKNCISNWSKNSTPYLSSKDHLNVYKRILKMYEESNG